MNIADRKGVSLNFIMENYTAHEIDYWKVYYSKEPSEKMLNQYLMTQFMAMFNNFNSKKKISPSEFQYPEMWKTPEQQDVEAIRKMLGGG